MKNINDLLKAEIIEVNSKLNSIVCRKIHSNLWYTWSKPNTGKIQEYNKQELLSLIIKHNDCLIVA